MSEVRTLPMGRELDAAVAVRVMGYQRRLTECNSDQHVVVPADWTDFTPLHWWGRDVHDHVPPLSTDIAAAATILEAAYAYSIERHPDSRRHECSIVLKESGASGYVACDTLPEAICRAALLAAKRDAKEGA